MKANSLFIFSFVIMVLATIVVVFFLNKFLLFINGYSMDLTKGARAGAFGACIQLDLF